MRKILYLIVLAMLFGTACSKNKVELSTEQRMQMADDYFAKKKYAKAANLYEEVSFERKSAATARAIMRQAESYFNMNKFVDARLKYHQFTQMFPDHPEVSNAFFRIAVCLYEDSLPPQYDQTETNQSIEAFKLFIEKYPQDTRFAQALEYIRKAQNKLLEKKFHNGYIHYKMKDYSGALMYFEEIIDLGNPGQLDKMSMYYSTLIRHKQKDAEMARAAFAKMQSQYPGAAETRKLARLIGKP